MNDRNSEAEEDLPEYMNNPIVNKYVGRMHLLVDDLYATTKEPQAEEVELLKDVLLVFHRCIIYDGKLAELDSILRLHYPNHYGKENDSCIDDLTNYPLSTIN